MIFVPAKPGVAKPSPTNYIERNVQSKINSCNSNFRSHLYTIDHSQFPKIDNDSACPDYVRNKLRAIKASK